MIVSAIRHKVLQLARIELATLVTQPTSKQSCFHKLVNTSLQTVHRIGAWKKRFGFQFRKKPERQLEIFQP